MATFSIGIIPKRIRENLTFSNVHEKNATNPREMLRSQSLKLLNEGRNGLNTSSRTVVVVVVMQDRNEGIIDSAGKFGINQAAHTLLFCFHAAAASH